MLSCLITIRLRSLVFLQFHLIFKAVFPSRPKKNYTDRPSILELLEKETTPRTLWQSVAIVCWKLFAYLPALCKSFFFSSGRVAARFHGSLGSLIVAGQPTPLTSASVPPPEIAGVPYDQGLLTIGFP